MSWPPCELTRGADLDMDRGMAVQRRGRRGVTRVSQSGPEHNFRERKTLVLHSRLAEGGQPPLTRLGRVEAKARCVSAVSV